jgi:hypothetical protein
MTGPQYIRLTATRILQPQQKKDGRVEMMHTVLQPPVVRLVPLPAMFNSAQQDGRTEHDMGNMVVSYQELFADVLQAIEDAAQAGRCIAIPMNATQLASAVTAALPKFPMPVKAGEMFDKVAFAEKATTPKNTAVEDVAGAVKVVQAADEIAQKWDDFVQTDGENTGAPAARTFTTGDLRLCEAETAWQVLAFDGEGWSVAHVPSELLRPYPSEGSARAAVRLAGYARRLVEVK